MGEDSILEMKIFTQKCSKFYWFDDCIHYSPRDCGNELQLFSANSSYGFRGKSELDTTSTGPIPQPVPSESRVRFHNILVGVQTLLNEPC